MLDPKYQRIHPEVYHVTSAADVLECAIGKGGVEPLVARTIPFGGGKPICDDVQSQVSSTMSNPDRWNNNFAKKMLDMQFNFSCGPLRVSQGCPEHWDRLHATHKTLLPLPGGRLELFKERVPHHTDEALVASLAGPHSMAHATKKGPPPSHIATRRVDTPLLNHLLMSTYIAPLPVKELPDDPRRLLQRRRDQENGVPPAAPRAPKDCDSVFSSTTVNVRRTSVAPMSSCVGAVADRASSRGSICSGTSRQSASKSAQSSASRVSKLRDEIQQERSLTALAMEHIREASAQLDTLERVLHMNGDGS
jgi:hypothetical protein